MPDGNKSVTAIQVVACLIGVLAIVGMGWAIYTGPDFLKDTEKLNGLIKFSVALAVIAIALISVFYLISGSNTTDDSKALRLHFMERLMNVTSMQWVATLIGLLTIGGMVWVIFSEASLFEKPETARGLITFSVAIVTVSIALIMVFYLIFGDGDKETVKDRFTFGKDILMVFVGILGTIMGFYYGADQVSGDQIKNIASVVQKPAGTQNPEQTAFDLLLKKDFEGAVKAFDDAFNTTPALPSIGNIGAIRKLLADNKVEFTSGDEAKKQEVWQRIFCAIADGKLTVGMTDEMKKTVEGYCKPAATPSPSPTATP